MAKTEPKPRIERYRDTNKDYYIYWYIDLTTNQKSQIDPVTAFQLMYRKEAIKSY